MGADSGSGPAMIQAPRSQFGARLKGPRKCGVRELRCAAPEGSCRSRGRRQLLSFWLDGHVARRSTSKPSASCPGGRSTMSSGVAPNSLAAPQLRPPQHSSHRSRRRIQAARHVATRQARSSSSRRGAKRGVSRTGLPTQNCEMNFQASGGMKAFSPSSPLEEPSSTADGVCGPSNVHTLTGKPDLQPSKS